MISCVCLKNVSLERLVPHWSHVMLGSAEFILIRVPRSCGPWACQKGAKPRWDPRKIHRSITSSFKDNCHHWRLCPPSFIHFRYMYIIIIYIYIYTWHIPICPHHIPNMPWLVNLPAHGCFQAEALAKELSYYLRGAFGDERWSSAGGSRVGTSDARDWWDEATGFGGHCREKWYEQWYTILWDVLECIGMYVIYFNGI